jgi:hypothetical protein
MNPLATRGNERGLGRHRPKNVGWRGPSPAFPGDHTAYVFCPKGLALTGVADPELTEMNSAESYRLTKSGVPY